MAQAKENEPAAEKRKEHGLGHVVKEIAANLEERLIAAEEVATATPSAEVNLATALEAVVTNPHEHERQAEEGESQPEAK